MWIAPGDGTVPSAVQSEVVELFSAPVAGATAVWIAGFFAPPLPLRLGRLRSPSAGGADRAGVEVAVRPPSGPPPTHPPMR